MIQYVKGCHLWQPHRPQWYVLYDERWRSNDTNRRGRIITEQRQKELCTRRTCKERIINIIQLTNIPYYVYIYSLILQHFYL